MPDEADKLNATTDPAGPLDVLVMCDPAITIPPFGCGASNEELECIGCGAKLGSIRNVRQKHPDYCSAIHKQPNT